MAKTLKHNHNFWLLWLAQVISGIGQVLYTAGIMVNVYQYSGSALQTAWVMVAGSLPAFLVGPFAGAVVDRYNRKNVLIIVDIISMVLVLLLLLFVSENHFNLTGLYTVVALLSLAAAFYRPAKMAIIPSIVQKENLAQANSILIGTGQAIMAIGFGFGGVLTLLIGFKAFILVNAATFILSAFITIFIRLISLPEKSDNTNVTLFQSAIDGFRDLKDHPLAYPLIVMEIIEFFPHGVWTSAVLLSFVEKALGGTAEDWGYIAGAYFCGMLAGAVLAMIFNKKMMHRTGIIIVVNAFLTSLLTLGFALSPTVLFAIVLSVVFGFPNSIRDVAQDTLLQSSVPQEILGRVYAVRYMFTTMMFMIAGLFLAWLADFSNTRYIYIGAAFLYFLTALYALGNKALRESNIEIE